MTDAPQDPRDDADPETELAGFRRSGDGASARFAAGEATIIRSLVSQVAELVTGDVQPASPADSLAAQLGLSDNAELPADPILARLLPDAYSDDPDAAGEFRRYTELTLRSAKAEVAQTVLATLPPGGGTVRLSQEDGQAWLRALNDVRLSLGVILGVTDDFDERVEDMSVDDPQAAYVGVYQWLAAIQESLVEALN